MHQGPRTLTFRKQDNRIRPERDSPDGHAGVEGEGEIRGAARRNIGRPPCSGGLCYFTTWDTEGSQTRRPGHLGAGRGTTTGGVGPGHCLPWWTAPV